MEGAELTGVEEVEEERWVTQGERQRRAWKKTDAHHRGHRKEEEGHAVPLTNA
jgi:hypothetical protein